MAEYRAAVMTDAGINLLADSLAEGYRIEFVKMVIGSGEYSEEEKKTDVLRKRTSLKEKQQEFGYSSVKSTEESEILLKAVISNAALDTGYYMREIGIIAKKEGDTEEILYSIAIAEVPDFLPGKENPTEVIQEYYTKVHNAEDVIINVKQGAYATAEDMQSVLTPEFEENEELENIETGESIFSILGKIKRAIRGLIEHKTSGDHDSRYLLKTAVVNTNTVTEAGYALDARQANPNVAGSLGAQIDTLNKTLSSHSHAWSAITGKPSTFPPSSHTHDDRYYTKEQIDAVQSFPITNANSQITVLNYQCYYLGHIVYFTADISLTKDVSANYDLIYAPVNLVIGHCVIRNTYYPQNVNNKNGYIYSHSNGFKVASQEELSAGYYSIVGFVLAN